MECIDEKIIDAIRENRFEEDIWFDNEWMASITYKKYKDLNFHIYFNDETKDYSFVTSLLHAIENLNVDSVIHDIIRHTDKEDFSVNKISTIQRQIEIAINNLQESLLKIKQWMDAKTGNREISYILSLKLTVNNKEVTLKDLTKSEKEKVKEQCREWVCKLFELDSYSEITAHEGFFISNTNKSLNNKID